MAIDKQTYAAARKYTDNSMQGAGAVAGKPCQIQSIDAITGGHRVTFLWVDNAGTSHTSVMDVMDGVDGAKGDKGDKGDKGNKGDTGATGKGISSVAVNPTNNHLIVTYDDSTTADAGEVPTVKGDTGAKGPQGIQGEKGDKGDKGDTGATGTAATISLGNVTSGVSPDITNSGTSSAAVFNFTLPKGDKGDKGDKGNDGQDGKSFEVKAQYPTEAALIAAHPTGQPGDAYFVGTGDNPDLYVWMSEAQEWLNNGPIAGVKGDKGDTGDDGYSPQATVSKSGSTAIITIRDKSGVTTATVTDGADGDPGPGLPEGGSIGQLVKKKTATDYDTEWFTPGTAISKDSTNAVTANSTDLVESGAVKAAIDAAVASAYRPGGSKTCAELTNALLIADNVGLVYIISDTGTTTADFVEGAGKEIGVGSDVGIIEVSTGVYKFNLLPGIVDLSNYIQKSQTAGLIKNDGTVDTTEYATAADVGDLTDLQTADKSSIVNAINEAASSGSGHIIIDGDGNAMAQRSKLKFIGMNVTDDEVNDMTIISDDYWGSFNFSTWLIRGGLNPLNYGGLEQLLKDEAAIRKLFTKHASVDYFAYNYDSDNAQFWETVLSNDLVAKWVNLRDYALDTLYGVVAIKTIMDAVDKYGYGEWALIGQVPTMASNTSPYGVVSTDATHESQYPWYAFDNSDTTHYDFNSRTSWIQYKFLNAVNVKKIKIRLYVQAAENGTHSMYIKGSDDGSTWTDLKTYDIGSNITDGNTYDIDLSDNTHTFLYYRIGLDTWLPGSYYAGLYSLQFYAWQAKGTIPVMTSDTAPYGTAICSTRMEAGRTDAFRAFDSNIDPSDSHCGWGAASGDTNPWVGYTYTNPVKATAVDLMMYKNGGYNGITFTIEASNDGFTTYDTLYTGVTSGTDQGALNTYKFTNNKYYISYRIHYTNHATCTTVILQFYGRELSISTPKMTANDAPYGVATSSSVTTSTPTNYQPWKAFDKQVGSDHRWTAANNSLNEWVQYAFDIPVRAKMAKFAALVDGNTLSSGTFKVQASNDNVTFTDIGTFTWTKTEAGQLFELTNDTAYKYWRVMLTSYTYLYNGTNGIAVTIVDFFGEDYSEYDWDTDHPRRYLYDHGLELEPVSSDLKYNNLDYRAGKKEPYQLKIPRQAPSTNMRNVLSS